MLNLLLRVRGRVWPGLRHRPEQGRVCPPAPSPPPCGSSPRLSYSLIALLVLQPTRPLSKGPPRWKLERVPPEFPRTGAQPLSQPHPGPPGSNAFTVWTSGKSGRGSNHGGGACRAPTGCTPRREHLSPRVATLEERESYAPCGAPREPEMHTASQEKAASQELWSHGLRRAQRRHVARRLLSPQNLLGRSLKRVPRCWSLGQAWPWLLWAGLLVTQSGLSMQYLNLGTENAGLGEVPPQWLRALTSTMRGLWSHL